MGIGAHRHSEGLAWRCLGLAQPRFGIVWESSGMAKHSRGTDQVRHGRALGSRGCVRRRHWVAQLRHYEETALPDTAKARHSKWQSGVKGLRSAGMERNAAAMIGVGGD